jgi:predicted XRE-type DNA-binding protein
MSDEAIYKQDDFESMWFDINGLTQKDWAELMSIARELVISNVFNGDTFKCTIAALVIFVSEGRGLRSDDQDDGEWIN